jgi:hypothetical protein
VLDRRRRGSHSRRPSLARVTYLVITLATLLLVSPMLGWAEDEGVEIKATFIVQIAKFVEWPAGSFESESTPIRVGVLGTSSLYNELRDQLRGAQANGRGFELRYMDDVERAGEVHILVVTNEGRVSLRQTARALRGMPVLSIGPTFEFAESGGILGVEIYQGKVAFEVNNRAARKAELRISSRVLKLASNVY